MNSQGEQPLLPHADLNWTPDGEAFSDRYGDIYYSRAGGLAEKHHVFVAGNGLPDRFARGLTTHVLEFGFGAGLSFFATAQCLLQTVPREPASKAPLLHFYSIEKHPLTPDEMRRLIAPWPELATLADELIDQWPDRVPGFHRRFLANGRIALTLVFGDITSVLPQIDGQFDAFYLDGFSPRRNAVMWSETVLKHLPRLGLPGARVATYSAARVVVDGLTAVGFSVNRLPGFGAKRHMLGGHLVGNSAQPILAGRGTCQEDPVVIIGAGVAGLTVARALARRGRSVRIFDGASSLGAGGSGNAAGIVAPVMSRDWNIRSTLTAIGLGFMRADWQALARLGRCPQGGFSGVIQLARHDRYAARQSDIAEDLGFDSTFAEWLSADALSELAGVPVPMPGWFFPGAGWLAPTDYLRALADDPLIELVFDGAIHAIEPEGAVWQGRDGHGQVIFSATDLVLANADALGTLRADLGAFITPCRGQVSTALRRTDVSGSALLLPLMREGYAVDLPDGRRVFGASFKAGDATCMARYEEQQENAARLAALSLELCQALPSIETWQARVSLRATTPDRLPMVGRLEFASENQAAEAAPALYVTAGHGSRGFTWCALLAESLVAEMLGEPGPLPVSLRAALAPQRFAHRAARRASVSV